MPLKSIRKIVQRHCLTEGSGHRSGSFQQGGSGQVLRFGSTFLPFTTNLID
jgi:hypothetical protein